MKKFKGTKGEWLLQEDFRKPKIINESGQVIFEHSISCYDDEDGLHKYYSNNKMKANAKLIAAAPELLEALLNIENDNDSIPKKIWDLRNKAINKALD